MMTREEEIKQFVEGAVEGQEGVDPKFTEALTYTLTKFDGALKGLAQSEADDKLMIPSEPLEEEKMNVEEIKNVAAALAGSLLPEGATEAKASLEEALVERLGEGDEASEKMKEVVVATQPAPSLADVIPFQKEMPEAKMQVPNVIPSGTLVAGMTGDDKIAQRVMGEMDLRLKGLTEEKIDAMSDEEINTLIGPEMVSGTAALITKDSEHTAEEFRRDFLKYMIKENDMNEIVEEGKRVLAKELDDFKKELDNLIENLDTREEIVKIDAALEKETNEENIKKLKNLRGVLMSSLHLSNITERFHNLGGKAAVLKRTKKNFKKEQENFYRYVKNSPKPFLDPSYLERDLKQIVPPRFVQQVQPLLYLFYREVTKNKVISAETVSYVNYFLINVSKSLLNKEEEDNNVASFKQSLIDVLTLLK